MIAADAERADDTERDSWLEKSYRLLGNRSAKGWMTPQNVAREVGLSYENFRKRFAERSGESPGQYQKRRRLEWACAAIYHGQHTMKDIADELSVSVSTINTYRARILEKMHAKNNTELTHYAIENRLVNRIIT